MHVPKSSVAGLMVFRGGRAQVDFDEEDAPLPSCKKLHGAGMFVWVLQQQIKTESLLRESGGDMLSQTNGLLMAIK